MAEEIQDLDRAGMSAEPVAKKSPFGPLANRDFRLLWLGESISLLGDQFYLIALPWLTLQLTGSGLALGTILMVAGIPRALFMLVGGAVVDRIAPRVIMRDSNLLRLVLTSLLTVLMLLHLLQFWMLYFFAFAFGLIDAFFHPAYMAMVPRLLKTEELEAGNAIAQGTSEIMQFIGQGPAGVLIGVLGVSFAFGFDAFTFLIAALAAQLIRGGLSKSDASAAGEQPSSLSPRAMIASIAEGIQLVRKDAVLPTMLVFVAAINLMVVGPFGVGIPTYAHLHFGADGAAAMGTIFSVFSGGALLGVLAAGMLRPRRTGVVVMFSLTLVGIGLAFVGLMPSLLTESALCLLLGFGIGIVNVLSISWLQRRTAPEIMGRVMSLVMLASVGLGPLSNALAGVLVDVNLIAMFIGAGVVLALVSFWGLMNPNLRLME